MAMTENRLTYRRRGDGGRSAVFTEQSDANARLIAVTPVGDLFDGLGYEVMMVTVGYVDTNDDPATTTQDGVTIVLDSGRGTAYDVLLKTGAANTQSTIYFPDGKINIMDGDVVKVTAPAGGAGITSSIAVYVEGL